MHKSRESLDAQQAAQTATKQRPIFFNTEMVKAILNETKVQTRRIVKAKPRECEDPNNVAYDEWFSKGSVSSPYGKAGDVLWVRENYKFLGVDDDDDVVIQFKDGEEFRFSPEEDCEEYWNNRLENLLTLMSNKDAVIVDEENERYTWLEKDVPFKPSIHMPQEVARIWLQIVDIRVERLNAISHFAAIEEGIESKMIQDVIPKPRVMFKNYLNNSKLKWYAEPERSFASLWASINGIDSWKKNPWVWVVSFKKIENPNK